MKRHRYAGSRSSHVNNRRLTACAAISLLKKHQTTVSWVWDVFDQDEHRALRISGEETAKGRPRDAWAAADDAMLGRIARSSMDQLAAFLTGPRWPLALCRRATRKWRWLTCRNRHPKLREYSACSTRWLILCRPLPLRPLPTMPNPFLYRPGGRGLPRCRAEKP
jgi:hypothetical protein